MKLISRFGFRTSYSGKGNPLDNAPMESFNAIWKKEEVYQSIFYDFESANVKLFDFIEDWYNRNRIHGSIDFLTPVAFENLMLNS